MPLRWRRFVGGEFEAVPYFCRGIMAAAVSSYFSGSATSGWSAFEDLPAGIASQPLRFEYRCFLFPGGTLGKDRRNGARPVRGQPF